MDSGLDAQCPSRESWYPPSVLDNLAPRSHGFSPPPLLFSFDRTYLFPQRCAFGIFYGFVCLELKKKKRNLFFFYYFKFTADCQAWSLQNLGQSYKMGSWVKSHRLYASISFIRSLLPFWCYIIWTSCAFNLWNLRILSFLLVSGEGGMGVMWRPCMQMVTLSPVVPGDLEAHGPPDHTIAHGPLLFANHISPPPLHCIHLGRMDFRGGLYSECVISNAFLLSKKQKANKPQ